MVYQGFQRSSRQNLSLKILVRIIFLWLTQAIAWKNAYKQGRRATIMKP
jgi:hypothetical protein